MSGEQDHLAKFRREEVRLRSFKDRVRGVRDLLDSLCRRARKENRVYQARTLRSKVLAKLCRYPVPFEEIDDLITKFGSAQSKK